MVDYHGAISLLQELKRNVEQRVGFDLAELAEEYDDRFSLAYALCYVGSIVFNERGDDIGRVVDVIYTDPDETDTELDVLDDVLLDENSQIAPPFPADPLENAKTHVNGREGNHLLDFEEIARIVRTLIPLGISKIRITGGEPLVRKGVDRLVEMISGMEGIRETTMTTNGQLLEAIAGPLARAGLERVNISLDTLHRRKFLRITGFDHFDRVWQGTHTTQRRRWKTSASVQFLGRWG